MRAQGSVAQLNEEVARASARATAAAAAAAEAQAQQKAIAADAASDRESWTEAAEHQAKEGAGQSAALLERVQSLDADAQVLRRAIEDRDAQFGMTLYQKTRVCCRATANIEQAAGIRKVAQFHKTTGDAQCPIVHGANKVAGGAGITAEYVIRSDSGFAGTDSLAQITPGTEGTRMKLQGVAEKCRAVRHQVVRGKPRIGYGVGVLLQ